MIGFQFSRYVPEADQHSPFERMLELFLELLTYTSGDPDEALDWLRQIDDEHNVSGEDYSVDEFIDLSLIHI